MLLAELEVFHTRPAVPTRRVALGHLLLPVEHAPGFGGLLLGAVVAQHIVGVDVELHGDVVRLIKEIERGERVVQPRLRHRFQVDRHGLSHSRHRMIGDDDDIEFDFGTKGSDIAQVLGAVYALERLAVASRHVIAPVLMKATRWRGPIGPALIAHLAGAQSTTLSALADPRGWALEMLGFPSGAPKPSKRDVTKRYRVRMRDVHPDHGGAAVDASKAILDLNEARRILTEELGELGRVMTLLLYPGAGSDASHSSLITTERWVAPHPCVRADFPYRQQGRRAPDRVPILLAVIRDQLDELDADAPLVMGGRSMGGRMCSLVAAGADGRSPPPRLVGLVLVSYPLHPPGKPDRLRVEHLPDIKVPTLFISGTNDPFGSPAEFAEWTATMPKRAKPTHLWVEGRGHDLKGADHTIVGAIKDFLDRWAG